MRVATVVRWSNGMVTVFDEKGEQISHLQGRYEDVKGKVLSAADENTSFKVGKWNHGWFQIDRENW